jgi:hypothetical protein
MTPNAALRDRLRALLPPGWRARVRVTDKLAEVVIEAAPVDLLAVDALQRRRDRGRGYAQVVPAAYEDAWHGEALVIRRLLEVAHADNTVVFDGRGERVGDWRVVSVWIGHHRRPFVVVEPAEA